MEFSEVTTYIKEHGEDPDVKKYLADLSKVTTASAKAFLTDEKDGKALLLTLTDGRVNEGIEGFKKKTMPSLIDAEVEKRHPAETPQDKRLRELEKKDAEREAKMAKSDRERVALELVLEKKLPKELAAYLTGETDEKTAISVEKVEKLFNEHVEARVKAEFKASGREVVQSNDKDKPVDYSKLSPVERITRGHEEAAAKRQAQQ